MIPQVYTYGKTPQIVYFKYVPLILCQFYLKRTIFLKNQKEGRSGRKKEDEFPETEEVLQDHRPENTSQKDHWDKEVKLYCI